MATWSQFVVIVRLTSYTEIILVSAYLWKMTCQTTCKDNKCCPFGFYI